MLFNSLILKRKGPITPYTTMKLSKVEQKEFLQKLGIDPDLPGSEILRLVREAHGRLNDLARNSERSKPEAFFSDVEVIRCEMIRASREIKAQKSQV